MIQRIFSNIEIREFGKRLWAFGERLLAIVVLVISYGFMLVGLNWTLQHRWVFPFVTIPLIGVMLFLGLTDLKVRRLPISNALTTASITILTATIGFGAISLWLADLGWAKYTPDNVDLLSYSNYYFWQFLDLIPLLKVNDTLGLVAPLQPVGVVAGLPVLMFRVYILFGLLKALKGWWSGRKENDSHLPNTLHIGDAIQK